MHTGRKGMKWGQHIFTKDDLRYANSGLSGRKYNVGVGIHYGADGIIKSAYKVHLDYHNDNAKQSILRGKKMADKLMNDKVMLEIYNRDYTAAVEEHHTHGANGSHTYYTRVNGTTKYAYDPNKSNPTNRRYYVY